MDRTRMPPGDHEEELRDRYRELLEELRVILPGVQVLFAFLLTAPFSSRFPDLDLVGRRGYFVALVGAAASTLLLLTPTAYHRLAPDADRARRLRIAVRLTVAGLATLGTAIVAALFVVTRFVFENTAATVVAGGLLLLGAVLWYGLPLHRRLAGR